MTNHLRDSSTRCEAPAALAQRRAADRPRQVPYATGALPATAIQLQIQRMADSYSRQKYWWAVGPSAGLAPLQRVLQANNKHRMPANEAELINDINAQNVTVSSGRTFHTTQDRQQVEESKKWTVTYNTNVLDLLGHNFEGDMSYVIHAHYNVTDQVTQMHAKDSDDGQVLFYINGAAARSQITAI